MRPELLVLLARLALPDPSALSAPLVRPELLVLSAPLALMVLLVRKARKVSPDSPAQLARPDLLVQLALPDPSALLVRSAPLGLLVPQARLEQASPLLVCSALQLRTASMTLSSTTVQRMSVSPLSSLVNQRRT